MQISLDDLKNALNGHVVAVCDGFEATYIKTEGLLILENADSFDSDYINIASVDICMDIIKQTGIKGFLICCDEKASFSANTCPPGLGLIVTELSVISVSNLLNRSLAEIRQENTAHPAAPATTFGQIFRRILDDDGRTEQILTSALHGLSPSPETYMRLILIRPDMPQNMQQGYLKENLLENVKQFFPGHHITVMTKDIVVLVSSETMNCPLTFSQESFEKFLTANKALAMISNSVISVSTMRIMYNQCLRVFPIALSVNIQDRVTRCRFFSRYTQYNVIDICALSQSTILGKNDIVYLCHPGVVNITRYDRANGTNLRDIMFAYLMNERSMTKTSEELYIHRNTLLYKIKKIEELLGESMDDPYLRQNLIFSCMVLRYREEYQKEGVVLYPYKKPGSKK